MGQQQLLLLVLGVLIVGLAVVVGIVMAKDSLRQSAVDHLVNRNMMIATEAVLWKQKSDPFNGGNAKYTGLETDGIAKLGLSDETPTGFFKITRATESEVEITGVSLGFPEVGARTLVQFYEIVSTDVAFDGTITVDEEPIDG